MRTWGALASADEARRRFDDAWEPVERTEEVETSGALGRVLSTPIAAPEDLPPFHRALMDGYACRAEDIAAVPTSLWIVGDVLMGREAGCRVGPGDCARIPTGGMLPEGADVVVPIEQADETGDRVLIRSSLAAGRHLIERGEDVRAGEPLLPAGHRLRPADIGALMGLGVTRVQVHALPRVGILSTGDEIVPADKPPSPGKVRDLNAHSLGASVTALGAVPARLGIFPDEEDVLFSALESALAVCDVVLLSAGSSVGKRDVVPGVIDRLGPPGILVHGVDIRPGKPTIFALCRGKPVFGLPGQPVSALNTFDLFVAPVLRRLMHLPETVPVVPARLAGAVRSADGREDHVRVRLEFGEGEWRATPLLGVSAMITTLVRAHGIVVVPARSEGYAAGDEVSVRLLGPLPRSD